MLLRCIQLIRNGVLALSSQQGNLVQFRLLRRVFLDGLLDFEMLSNGADTMKLVGQFAALLASISFAFTLPLLMIGGLQQDALWGMEHFLIATTMAVAGLFSMLSWESIFPDRRDLLVLGPLPLARTTVFLAKLSALSSALLVGIVALNVFTGMGWVVLFEPNGGGPLGLIHSFAAYWSTVLIAGSFVFCCVLIVHGLSSLVLSRRMFLRVSGMIQVMGFAFVLADYILEPSMESVPALSAPANQALLHALPSYWFLGVFQQLNGSMRGEFSQLARLGWIGFGLAAAGASAAVSLIHWRKVPRIIEEPEIPPAGPRWDWVARLLGNSISNSVLLFSWRTLLRSRQHRLVYGFFLSIGMIVVFLYVLVASAEHTVGRLSADTGVNLLIGTTMMMCLSILGTRIVLGVPSMLRANWIFQVTQINSPLEYARATQRTLFTLGVAPAGLFSLLLILWIGPSWPLFTHLCALILVGLTLVNVVNLSFRKLPFTCSWKPGKVNVLVTFFGGGIVGIPLTGLAARLEMPLLHTATGRLQLVIGLALLAVAAHWLTRNTPGALRPLTFEEKEEASLVSLNLHQTKTVSG
jgi:hypothetical protein